MAEQEIKPTKQVKPAGASVSTPKTAAPHATKAPATPKPTAAPKTATTAAPKPATAPAAKQASANVAPKAPAAPKASTAPAATQTSQAAGGKTISAMQTPIVPKSTLAETQPEVEPDKKKKKKIDQRLKSSNISIDDLETLNEKNLKQYRSRVTRNRFVIIFLIILLIAAVATIAIILSIKRMENNCKMVLKGDVDAEFVIDGKKLDAFRTPAGIQGNRVYVFDADLQINSSGNFNVYFIIEAYQGDVKLNNSFAYEYNHDLFRTSLDGRYVSAAPIAGGQTINLFNGVVLDDAYEDTLTTENFSLVVTVYFEQA